MAARYRGAIWREDDLSVFDFEGGNLTEFSRLGNPAAAVLMYMLEGEPAKAAVVGDSSDNEALLAYPYFEDIYETLWGFYSRHLAAQKLAGGGPAGGNMPGKYIVNSDKQEYVDMAAYEQRCREAVQGDPERYALCHHPLPLLAS